VRAAIATLTARAVAAGTVSPAVRADDVMAIISAMRGLIQADGDIGPGSWPRFLGIHLAGLRSVQDPGDAAVHRDRPAQLISDGPGVLVLVRAGAGRPRDGVCPLAAGRP
jgi:hypothetical protein